MDGGGLDAGGLDPLDPMSTVPAADMGFGPSHATAYEAVGLQVAPGWGCLKAPPGAARTVAAWHRHT